MTKVITLDNFLDKDDFETLRKISLEDVPNNSTKVYVNRITKENIVSENSINPDIIKKLHTKYHDKTLSILKDISPEKAELYEYSDFLIVKTG